MDYGPPAPAWVAADTDEPATTPARPWTARRRVDLGMPQLDGCGLSETWLQATCGDIHWRGLAHSLGRPAERWADATGRRVYAAFGLVRLRGARLGDAAEGQGLHIRSQLVPVGRSQAWSRHRLASATGSVGVLDMLSVFVGRGDDGSNRSVRRVAMREQAPAPAEAAATALVAHARAWRLAALPAPVSEPLRFMPCPRGDFNGAGLVYFPRFSAWADRALFGWGLLGQADRVVERECLFRGNLDVGDPVEIVLLGTSDGPGGRCCEVAVRCPSHGRLLARIRTTAAAT